MKLNYRQIKATNEVFKRLNQLRRWTGIISMGTYNELCKQALNCIIAYFLACYIESRGIPVNWARFPKIALYRAFQKVYVVFNTPESKYEEIFRLGNINKQQFNTATRQKIVEKTDIEFANFLCEVVSTDEEQIYKAATKIATLIELQELGNKCSREVYNRKLQEILDEIKQYEHVKGVKEIMGNEKLFKLLQFLSSSGLRNHIRWCEVGYVMECSILGHLFDTACFCYFMSLEENPNDEQLASQRFFMGIFHDIAEAWTTDIPSPIKDSIDNFRPACEKYEQRVIEENLYSQLPGFMVSKLKMVMFEDPQNISKHKAIIKGGDYLSADSECWRQYQLGSRDPYFKDAMKRRIPGIENGSVALTPCCRMLFQYFRNYSDKLNLEYFEEDDNL